MRIFLVVLAAVAALPLSSHAFNYNPEHAGPVERVHVNGIGQLDYQRLFEAVSEPGESMDVFARRVGPALRAYSDATGFEACGVLATDGERFGVVVGSNHAQVACANFSSKVPERMASTGVTIHSHGKAGRRRANRNDLRMMGRGEMRLDRAGMMSGQSLTAFSEMDFAGGPGYLAIPGGVIFQEGTHASVRRVIGTDTQGEAATDRLASF